MHNRSSQYLILILLLVLTAGSVWGTRGRPSFTLPEQPVHFAQLTDAHLFDEGWKQPIFAGHFHHADRAIYGSPSGVTGLAVEGHIAGKTYVAPPFAIKNQLGKSATVRGFLLASVQRG